MIVTNRLLSSSNFSHHSVALANVETYVTLAGAIIIRWGLDKEIIIKKARSASFKDVLSSAEVDALLGRAAPYFFRWMLASARQQRMMRSILDQASKSDTRVEH